MQNLQINENTSKIGIVEFWMRSGNVIPMDVVIRLYEGARYHIEQVYGIDFKEFSDDVLDPNHEFNR